MKNKDSNKESLNDKILREVTSINIKVQCLMYKVQLGQKLVSVSFH